MKSDELTQQVMKHQSVIEVFLQTLNHYVLGFQNAIDPLHQRLQEKGSLWNKKTSSLKAKILMVLHDALVLRARLCFHVGSGRVLPASAEPPIAPNSCVH